MSNNLEGICILNTRPLFAKAHQRFAELIETHGGQSVSLPLQDIQALDIDLPPLQHIDYLIFVSQAAVTYFFSKQPQHLNKNSQMIAIGKATAKALEMHHQPVGFFAEEGHSEALLQAAIFQNVEAKNILWVKGTHGRSLIGDTLKNRGAKVTELNVYQSIPIPYSPKALEEIWQRKDINMVLVTSEQAFLHLQSLCSPDWLSQKNIICFSQRLADIAKPFIKGHILMSQHDKILETLLSFKAKYE
jgi:uroporphyrinogen-III synthase